MRVSTTAAGIALGAVSAIHFGIAFGEIFLFKRIYPRMKQFNFSAAEAVKVAPIVANAGLYNAFLASAVLWSAVAPGAESLRLFSLTCAMVAGIFGAVTLKAPRTLAMQTLPAAIAAVLVLSAR
jgi:putative membrane protein